jgi:NADH:ubiquinone oxidoreductase subunit K
MVDGVTTGTCEVIALIAATTVSIALLIVCTVLALVETFNHPSTFSYWWIGFILCFGSTVVCLTVLVVWYRRTSSMDSQAVAVDMVEKSRDNGE